MILCAYYIDQIRHLQDQKTPEPFAIELANGRVIQIFDARSIATNESKHGTVGIPHDNGAFEVIRTDSIIAISVGVHPVETERMAKLRYRFAPKQ